MFVYVTSLSRGIGFLALHRTACLYLQKAASAPDTSFFEHVISYQCQNIDLCCVINLAVVKKCDDNWRSGGRICSMYMLD